jgi:hypothetical protein
MFRVALSDSSDGGEIQMDPVQAGKLVSHIEASMPWYWWIYALVVPTKTDVNDNPIGGAKFAYLNWQETCSAATGDNAAALCTVAREAKNAAQTSALTRIGLGLAVIAGIAYGVHAYRKSTRHG